MEEPPEQRVAAAECAIEYLTNFDCYDIACKDCPLFISFKAPCLSTLIRDAIRK